MPTRFDQQGNEWDSNETDLYPERAQQIAAQICILAVEKTREYISKAIRNIRSIQKKPKSKREYNSERKRDFRANRSTVSLALRNFVKRETRVFVDAPEEKSAVSPRIEVLRSKILEQVRSFGDALLKLDLRDQRLGDDGGRELSIALRGLRLQSLCLTNNNITDVGMRALIESTRSCGTLEEIYLNNNSLRDAVEYLMEHYAYFSSLRLLNLSSNELTHRSFLCLGRIVSLEMHPLNCNLSTLLLGGNTHLNQGIRILLSFLFCNPHSSVSKLALADSNIGDMSLQAIAAYVFLSKGLKSLNISRNMFTSMPTKRLFLKAVRHNQSLEHLAVFLCDLPSDVTDWVGRSPDEEEWIGDTDLVFKVNGIICKCENDALQEKLIASASEIAVQKHLIFSMSDVVKRWDSLQAELDASSESEQTAAMKIISILFNAAEFCASLDLGSPAIDLGQTICELRGNTASSALSSESYDKISQQLINEIGSAFINSPDFSVGGHLLLLTHRFSPSVAYVYFMSDLYVSHLESLTKKAIEKKTIATAVNAKQEKKRRKDLVRSRKLLAMRHSEKI